MTPRTARIQQTAANRLGQLTLGHLLLATLVALTAALVVAFDPAPAPGSTPPAQTGRSTTQERPVVWNTTTATWYGPGFYGNPTACGQRYTQAIRGVAIGHTNGRWLARCGDRFVIRHRGRAVLVTVIDRCPGCSSEYHRFDLSARTAMDLCACWTPHTMTVKWRTAPRRGTR